ncbi:hypothetical protein [Paraburkholderia phenoliruptrix]|uniref:hypothetical protein n=1 Tax=Paraburkholderia phenoliruptrix TaxID=252970 RepID=UPI003D989D95
MSQDFFEVFSIPELFEKSFIDEEPPKDPKEAEWFLQLRDREDLDDWLILSIWGEVDYAVNLFWKVVTDTFGRVRKSDGDNQESDVEFFERCLRNHLYTLDEIYDGDIVLEPVVYLLKGIEEHRGEPFHPTMLLIAYALWSLDKAIAGLLESDISKSTFGVAIGGSALMEAFRWHLRTPSGIEMMNKIGQSHRARIRHAKDPKQSAKSAVKESWEAWQRNRLLYKGKASFARAMLKEHPELESQKVIEDWCREWEKKKNEDVYKSAAD